MMDLTMDELAAVSAALTRAKMTLRGAIRSEPDLTLAEQKWALTHTENALAKVTDEIRIKGDLYR